MRLPQSMLAIFLASALPFAAVGCHWACRQKQQPVPSPEPVEVHGAVRYEGSVPVRPQGLTLGEAVTRSGGLAPIRDANGFPVTGFVRFAKGNTDYIVSADLLSSSAIGLVPVSPGEKIVVEPWTETDLARFLLPKTSATPTRVTYVPDQSRLKSLYENRIQTSQGNVELAVALLVGDQPVGKPNFDPTVRIPRTGGVTPLGLSSARSAGKNTSVVQDPFVMVIDRTVGQRLTKFVISMGTGAAPSEVFEQALLFDGDVVTITLPEAIPIVAASLVIAQRRRSP